MALAANQAAHLTYSVTVTDAGPASNKVDGATGTSDVRVQADATGAPTLSAQTLSMVKQSMDSRFIQAGGQVYAYYPEMRGYAYNITRRCAARIRCGFNTSSLDSSYSMPTWQVRLTSYNTMPASIVPTTTVPASTFSLNAPATAQVHLPDLGDGGAAGIYSAAYATACHAGAGPNLKALLRASQSPLAACQAAVPGITQDALVLNAARHVAQRHSGTPFFVDTLVLPPGPQHDAVGQRLQVTRTGLAASGCRRPSGHLAERNELLVA